MEYTEVKRAHIVPRFYLSNFAVDDAVLLNVDGVRVERPVSIDGAAVRRTFYRRYRPDGTPVDDIEWSLSQLEAKTAQKLRQVRETWPPPLEEIKAPLAELLSFQFVRGPAWKKWREDQAKELINEFRRDPQPTLHNGIWIPISQKQINEYEDRQLSETGWLTKMMVIANRLITIFGSMRWHLIEFSEPLLALSDQPVTAWPMDSPFRRPEPNQVGLGALNFFEVKAPLSPTLALLMTWQEPPDATEILQGNETIAASLNAFTIANAERQWMSMPGGTVPIADGYLDPISQTLIPGYGKAEAEASATRQQAQELLEKKLGQELHEAVDENGQMTAEVVVAADQGS